MDTNQTEVPPEIHFFKKEIARLNNEIKQYQDENFLLKTELKKTASVNHEYTSLKGQIKEIMSSNEDTLVTCNAEILKLKEKIKEKDSQLTILSDNLDNEKIKLAILEKEYNDRQEGFKEERKFLALAIESEKMKMSKLNANLELKDKQIIALKNKFEEYLAKTSNVVVKGKLTKKDTAYQEVISLKEEEITKLQRDKQSLTTEVNKLSAMFRNTEAEIRYRLAENKVLREKHIQAAEFCDTLSTGLKETDAVNYKKLAGFCRKVAEASSKKQGELT